MTTEADRGVDQAEFAAALRALETSVPFLAREYDGRELRLAALLAVQAPLCNYHPTWALELAHFLFIDEEAGMLLARSGPGEHTPASSEEVPFVLDLTSPEEPGRQIEAPGFVVADLRALSEALERRDPLAQRHGAIGGEWSYGQDFENDVFAMHPYFWGDCECGFDERDKEWDDAHPHADSCYQSELERRYREAGAIGEVYPSEGLDLESAGAVAEALAAEWGLPAHGCAAHCTCGRPGAYAAWRTENDHVETCGSVRPNFLHKQSGLRVDWYKYIGRSTTLNAAIRHNEWRQIIAECMKSIGA